jgi:RNA polymerase sigma factor (sigma-70 family)
MQETAVNPENDQRLELVDHQIAARKLQDLLSLRLPSFYRCAFRLLGNSADAEDAVQEALLAAYKHINQFRGQSQISTWLTTIVRDCALMQLRKRQRQIHFPLNKEFGKEQPRFLWEGLADERPSPEEELRTFELTSCLRKGTALLSPTLRRTFQLRVVDGLSIVETAPNPGSATRNGQGADGTRTSKTCAAFAYVHLDDRALVGDRVARGGFVLGPRDVCHRARIRHCE